MGETNARVRQEPRMTQPKDAIRDAATIILWRAGSEGTEVLMGQRGSAAAFMPNKVVFPGGAVDAADGAVPLAEGINTRCADRLAMESTDGMAHALLTAAVREMWEETGLVIGAPGAWPDAPADWSDFAATGHRPSAASFRFVFRAVTPPGRPRRFDARFFLAPATAVVGDPDDFSRASDELSHLRWIPLARVREVDLPFITEVVLAEVEARLPEGVGPAGVPFVTNDTMVSDVTRLR